jgi:hypothetical protein
MMGAFRGLNPQPAAEPRLLRVSRRTMFGWPKFQWHKRFKLLARTNKALSGHFS